MNLEEMYKKKTGLKIKEWVNADLCYTYKYIMWLESKIKEKEEEYCECKIGKVIFPKKYCAWCGKLEK